MLLGNITIPKRVEEALQDPRWKAAMDEEMMALEKNNTWEIVTLPRGMSVGVYAKILSESNIGKIQSSTRGERIYSNTRNRLW